jgi:hypothetical protein
VVIAVRATWMMQVSTYEIIGMVPMRNSFVSAARRMFVCLFVAFAAVLRRAICLIGRFR